MCQFHATTIAYHTNIISAFYVVSSAVFNPVKFSILGIQLDALISLQQLYMPPRRCYMIMLEPLRQYTCIYIYQESSSPGLVYTVAEDLLMQLIVPHAECFTQSKATQK